MNDTLPPNIVTPDVVAPDLTPRQREAIQKLFAIWPDMMQSLREEGQIPPDWSYCDIPWMSISAWDRLFEGVCQPEEMRILAMSERGDGCRRGQITYAETAKEIIRANGEWIKNHPEILKPST